MAGYGEENPDGMNGYEEEEEVEEEAEEVEEVYEEVEEEGDGEADDGAAVAAEPAEMRSEGGGRGLAEVVGDADAGGEEGRDADSGGGDASGKIFVGGVAWETTEGSKQFFWGSAK